MILKPYYRILYFYKMLYKKKKLYKKKGYFISEKQIIIV